MDKYPNIDMKGTGIKLKYCIKRAGYDVKYIQDYLHLSCPQPVYRWFKGLALPSVDHLYALSVLLEVHMEDLLVPKQPLWNETQMLINAGRSKRLVCYYERIQVAA